MIHRWDSIESHIKSLNRFLPKKRKITHLVVHHTWRPTQAQWRGLQSAESILNYWKQNTPKSWKSRLGTQYIIGPKGDIYLCVDSLDEVTNGNSSQTANHRGIGIEMVGDFDFGREKMTVAQEHALYGLLGALCVSFNLTEKNVYLHREFNKTKTCPGSGIAKWFVQMRTAAAIGWARNQIHPL